MWFRINFSLPEAFLVGQLQGGIAEYTFLVTFSEGRIHVLAYCSFNTYHKVMHASKDFECYKDLYNWDTKQPTLHFIMTSS